MARHTWEQRVRQMAELIERYHGGEVRLAERGQKLEIRDEKERKSFTMWRIGIALGQEINGLKELYNGGYAEPGDVAAFLDRLKAWQDDMEKLCGRHFFRGKIFWYF